MERLPGRKDKIRLYNFHSVIIFLLPWLEQRSLKSTGKAGKGILQWSVKSFCRQLCRPGFIYLRLEVDHAQDTVVKRNYSEPGILL